MTPNDSTMLMLSDSDSGSFIRLRQGYGGTSGLVHVHGIYPFRKGTLGKDSSAWKATPHQSSATVLYRLR